MSVVPVDEVAEVGRYVFKHVGLEFASPAGNKTGRSSSSMSLRDVPVRLADQAGCRPVHELLAEDPTARRFADAWLDFPVAASRRRTFRTSCGFYSLTGTQAMGVGEIRRRTHLLRVEDRQLVEVAFVAAGLPPVDLDDGEPALDPVEDDERPRLLAMTWDAFVEAQAAVEAPVTRGAAGPVLEVFQAAREGPAFHALVCHLVEFYGAHRAAHLLVASMGRPASVEVDERGTYLVAYQRERADDWTL